MGWVQQGAAVLPVALVLFLGPRRWQRPKKEHKAGCTNSFRVTPAHLPLAEARHEAEPQLKGPWSTPGLQQEGLAKMHAQECGCVTLAGTGMEEETQSPGCHSEQLRCMHLL